AFTTLRLVLDAGAWRGLSTRVVEMLTAEMLARPTYLDKFYALQPGRPNGAKRLIVLLPGRLRGAVDEGWLDEIGAAATVVWCGEVAEEELADYEFAWQC